MMNTVLALTITIPDWILDGPFWAGYGCGVLSIVVVFCVLASKWSPWG